MDSTSDEHAAGPSSGPATTANTFGKLTFDPSPMGATSLPTTLRPPSSNSSSGMQLTRGSSSAFVGQQHRSEANKSGSDSASASCSDADCDDDDDDFDASWIQLTDEVSNIDGKQITEKFDKVLSSLSQIDTSTSVGPSLNPGLVDLEQQLITLREDNIRLLSVLEATNEAMKKNLTFAHELKEELKSSHDDYDSLKSTADTAIDTLRADNERLRRRVTELEKELEDRNNEPVTYPQFDISKEINMQEMSSQIAGRDFKISQLTGEVNNLTAQLEKTRSDLSRSMMSSPHPSQPQHLMAFDGNRSSCYAPSQSSIGGQSEKPNAEENNATNGQNGTSNNTPNTPSPSFLQNVLGEMHNLKAIIDLLRGEKQTLESRLAGRRHRSSRRHHHSSPRHQESHPSANMGTSYTVNTAQGINLQDQQSSSTDPQNNMETEDISESYHRHGRHRRHHRHHASKALRRLEKQMAKTAQAPIINSAFMFKGFTQYSNQPQQPRQ